MPDITLPNVFVSGTNISSTEVNDNFEALVDGALNKTGDTMTGTLTARDIAASTTATYDIGVTGTRFRDLWLSRNAAIGGTLDVAGTATFAGGLAIPSQAQYDVFYASSATAWARLAKPASGSMLFSSGTAPSWEVTPTLNNTANNSNTFTLRNSSNGNAARTGITLSTEDGAGNGNATLGTLHGYSAAHATLANTVILTARSIGGLVLESTGTGTGPVSIDSKTALVVKTDGVALTAGPMYYNSGVQSEAQLAVARGGTGIASLTANRIPYGNGTSAFQSSANLTFDGTAFVVTGTGRFTTSLSTPSIITASGALTITPAAGSGLNVVLSSTGDFAINTSQFYIDTSTAMVGVGTASPGTTLDIVTGLRVRGTGFTSSAAVKDLLIVGQTNSSTQTVYPGLSIINRQTTTESLADVRIVAADGVLAGQFLFDGIGTANGWGAIAAGLKTTTNHPFIFGTNNLERARISAAGNMGINTGATVSARLHVISTTEQFRAGYDASNYYSTTVSSAGAVTFDATGASAAFHFSDTVNATTFVGALTGNASTATTAGTVTTAAQPTITSLGTLTALAVDNITLDANTILATTGDVAIKVSGTLDHSNFTSTWGAVTTVPVFRMRGGALGAGLPGTLLVAENNSGGSGAAGAINLMDMDDGNKYVWVDNTGDLRTFNTRPVEDGGTTSDTAGTVVGDQSSWHARKTNIRAPGLTPAAALARIVSAEISDYEFQAKGYRTPDGSAPQTFTGFIGRNRTDWFLKNVGPQQEPALNEISILGHCALAFRNVDERLAALEAKLERPH